MKRLSLILLSLCVGFSAFADEGMWLPSLISSRIDDMRSKGFRLTAEDVYSVNRASMKDAVVLFGRGCTGEIVSKQGLLLTNHHCGHSSIQRLSSVEHDYLLDGFWALSREQELPCEGLTVSILERMEDVTDRISAGESAESIVKEAEASGKGLGASVERMYYGNQYFLFVYKVFRDVRLVGAPPSALGSFGGNTDNWIWPRHTCDFSVFRIYAGPDNEPAAYSPENRPYVPRRSFPISTGGIREGDFTMIYGFPGNTQQYIISDAVDYVQHRSDPMKIALRTQRLDIMGEAQKASAEVRIKYANKYVSVANAWKKWQGEVLGLERLGTVDSRRRYEAEFEQWAADRPEYAGLLDSMRAAYAAVTEPYFESELYRESVGAIEVLNFVDRLAAINASEKLTGEEKAAKIETLRRAFYKDYEPDVDRRIAKAMLKEYLDRSSGVPAALSEAVAASGSADAFIDGIFDSSRFVSPDGFTADTDGDSVSELSAMLSGVRKSAAGMRYRNLSDVPAVRRWYRTYLRALREFDTEREFFPDANLTLRVAYGSVGGYEYADGEYHLPFTTLDGVIEKGTLGVSDYVVPERLRRLYETKDYGRWAVKTLSGCTTVPTCFLATNHTTGGNSGSPIINGRGELVGINFDRTWRSTMSDIEFDPEICRNISVDIRYVLFFIEKYGGAGYLLEEMDLR